MLYSHLTPTTIYILILMSVYCVDWIAVLPVTLCILHVSVMSICVITPPLEHVHSHGLDMLVLVEYPCTSHVACMY